MIDDAYREWNRSHDKIRRRGAVGNLNRGIEITTNGVAARLIAWPGNGFQTESVHVVTLRPGDETERYTYDMAEEALFCVWGAGEVWLRDRWVTMAPGDIAFIPATVPRAFRNPKRDGADFVLVNQITPPQFDLYEPAGFYNREYGVMEFDAIEAAKLDAAPGGLTPATDVRLRESDPDVRPWNLPVAEIRQNGALFTVFRGADFGGLGTPMLLVLWPGYGVRSAGLHMGGTPAGARAEIHTHPDSDECLFNWIGRGQVYCDDTWMDSDPLDCLLAPCGVHHTVGGSPEANAGPSYGCGFASPPQLDLYLRTPFYHQGRFDAPSFATLAVDDGASKGAAPSQS
jgi:mannose-6-phosphate isomerase-like protein (cupin superfamily)